MNKLLTVLTITLLLVGLLSTVYALDEEFIEEVIETIQSFTSKKVTEQKLEDIKKLASTDTLERVVDCTKGDLCNVHVYGGELDVTFQVSEDTKENIDLQIENKIDELILAQKETKPTSEKKLQYSEVIKYEK
jgi:hypothetical protein